MTDRACLTTTFAIATPLLAALLNDVVLGETQQFFERVTGAATEPRKEPPRLPDDDDDEEPASID